jgi:hypothetical protein
LHQSLAKTSIFAFVGNYLQVDEAEKQDLG